VAPLTPNALHHLGLEGAAVLQTPAFALAQRAVADCIARDAMGAFYGAAGNGKTFAVRAATQTIDREVIRLDCQWGMTYRGLVEALLEKVTGGLLLRGNRNQLERALIRELADRPLTLVVDEAQRLKAEGIEILRHLHDDEETRFALLLVGGNGCWKVLSSQPMLRSRLHRVVEFKALPPRVVAQLMPRFHPVIAGSPPEVLKLVDRRFAHGSLRNWTNFVVTALDICTDAGRANVDADVAENAFRLLGVQQPARGRRA